MKRRAFLFSVGALAMLPVAAHAHQDQDGIADGRADWHAWKDGFLAADGRVIDHLQDEASHSEGQGYALVLSVFHGDRTAFDLIRNWTDANLAKRADGLLNWRLDKGAIQPRPENATDGDIFYAWGLCLGGQRFDLPEALDRSRHLAKAIADTCLNPDPRDSTRLVVLPAAEGFLRGTMVTLNPSYIMPRALRDLALLTHDTRLAKAADDGEDLLREIAETGLAPDWIEIDIAGLRPSTLHKPQSGYDALRVPLYLIWSGRAMHPAVEKARRMLGAHAEGDTPVVTDLGGQIVSVSSTYAGYASLRALILREDPLRAPLKFPRLDTAQGYYPATLDMLSRVAAAETGSALISD
jgi:endoglucanase